MSDLRVARPPAWLRFSRSEARTHAVIAAIIMWLVAAIIAFAGSGYRSVFGPLKGADFIQLYTFGHIDRQTAHLLYDAEALYRLQTELVPESAPERRLPVYPPHVVMFFRPFAGLSYGTAALLWAATLIATYAGCIWLAWRPFRAVLHDRRLLIAAAAAFPPFWFLVLNGQSTIVPLLGFCLGWMALTRDHRFLAGAAFSLLLLKPQFALILVPLVLVCREWAMLAGAAVGVGAQVMAIVSLLGSSVLWQFADVVARFPQIRQLLEPRPEQMHSISAITNGLPGNWGTIAWALLSSVVIIKTIQVWRAPILPSIRVGMLIVASVLVNPHVFAYDAAVLALPLVWFAAWIYDESRVNRNVASTYTLIVYGLYVTFFAPTAAFVPVQASVILLGWLFVLISRQLVAPGTLTGSRYSLGKGQSIVTSA